MSSSDTQYYSRFSLVKRREVDVPKRHAKLLYTVGRAMLGRVDEDFKLLQCRVRNSEVRRSFLKCLLVQLPRYTVV
jgi:hypothetical protein